jgi:hypothetical protein
MTPDAIAITKQAYEHAIRLGHSSLASEHFLLALSGADQPAGVVLREHGVTPERVEAQIVHLAGAGLFAGLDTGALAAIGIDADAVGVKLEASFGQEALARAARAAGRTPSRFDLRSRTGVMHDGVFFPHGHGTDQALVSARRAAQAWNAAQFGVEHLTLALLAGTEGRVPAILSALVVSGPALRAAIVDRYQMGK